MQAATPSAVRVGLAGFGFWGSKLGRNLFETPNTRLIAVSDPDPGRRQAAKDQYGVDAAFGDVREMIASAPIDAVVLATPAEDHYTQARAALFAGKHVLVEKPLAMKVSDCEELERLAEERGLTLMVGHTFLYSSPVRALRELVRSGELGNVMYCAAQRLNLGAIRSDTSAMWDLAPHDVSIMLHLLDDLPVMVTAQQHALLDQPQEDVAFLSMMFSGGVVGHVHTSRLDPRKVRQLTVVGDRRMAVYDDTDFEAPLKVYDKGVDRDETPLQAALADAGFGHHRLEVRTGDMIAPKITMREPLRVEIDHFADCCLTGRIPDSDGRNGRDVVAVLEAAHQSSVLGGVPTPVRKEADGDARAAA